MSDAAELFWAKVAKAPVGCWEWTGAIQCGGYGTFKVHSTGRQTTAHRFAYEFTKGPIPDGLTIDHLCRNRACVNPDHLEPVPRGENSLRGNGPAALNARKTECKRGHGFTIENTRMVRGGRSRECKECKRAECRTRRARRKLEAQNV